MTLVLLPPHDTGALPPHDTGALNSLDTDALLPLTLVLLPPLTLVLLPPHDTGALTSLRHWCSYLLTTLVLLPPHDTGALTSSRHCNSNLTFNNTDEDIKPFHQIPGPKGLYTVPYLGSALQFKPFSPYTIDDIITVIENNKNKYGDIMRLRLGKDFVVFISHPDLAKVVFQYPYQEHVRARRRMVSVTTTSTRKMSNFPVVADYVPMIGNVTNDFVKRLKQQKLAFPRLIGGTLKIHH
ncbi:CYP49A [Mytilus edulis]|uniref:CYP49A n=1 Tax=Mytilus edulis TaxID=6550 RepID=A0A8S3UEK9_MYTED|nr:CYP49A [Mytilus edulis]